MNPRAWVGARVRVGASAAHWAALRAGLWAALWVGTLAGPLGAQSSGAAGGAGERADEPTRWQWELDLGYGYGIDMSSSATFLGDVRFVGIAPRLGRTVGGWFLEDTRAAGRVRFFLELPAWVSLEPRRGYAAGATLLARYTSRPDGLVQPFVELGAGPIYLDFDNDGNQSDGLSFTLQGGAGLKVPLGRSWAAISRVQLHHISNAGLRRPNPGINGLLVTVGFSHQVR